LADHNASSIHHVAKGGDTAVHESHTGGQERGGQGLEAIQLERRGCCKQVSLVMDYVWTRQSSKQTHDVCPRNY